MLDQVAESDVVVPLVGARYSKPTEDEFDEARRPSLDGDRSARKYVGSPSRLAHLVRPNRLSASLLSTERQRSRTLSRTRLAGGSTFDECPTSVRDRAHLVPETGGGSARNRSQRRGRRAG